MSDFKTKVGNNIKLYRNISGLTLKELAKKIGLSEPTMQKYEAGHISRVDVELIEKIADALGCTPNNLTGWEEPQVDYQVTLNDGQKAVIEWYDNANELELDMLKRLMMYRGGLKNGLS